MLRAKMDVSLHIYHLISRRFFVSTISMIAHRGSRFDLNRTATNMLWLLRQLDGRSSGAKPALYYNLLTKWATFHLLLSRHCWGDGYRTHAHANVIIWSLCSASFHPSLSIYDDQIVHRLCLYHHQCQTCCYLHQTMFAVSGLSVDCH